MKLFNYLLLLLFTLSGCTQGLKTATSNLKDNQWTANKANNWQKNKGWLTGCNYIPATASNQLEMWQKETFDTVSINRELGLAKSLGFNSVRVFLHDLLWEQDSTGFINRAEQFLSIAHKHKIGTMFVLFNGVWDPNPKLGKQNTAKPNVHLSGWVQSPGAASLVDSASHYKLKNYLKGFVKHFENDKRIDAWDIYNDHDNVTGLAYLGLDPKNKAELSFNLLKKAILWIREVNPSQPITTSIWLRDLHEESKITPADKFILEASDLISFHNYDGNEIIEQKINQLKAYNRPILCTEYMARGNGSFFEKDLPVLKKYNIGAYNWGLVAGKTQANFPWDSWTKSYTAAPNIWFHDIFHKDGTPYNESEVEFIRKTTK
ncbi:MAG TPA: hypothetical protein VNI52_06540 [Sphingobacteriaceae bacterium]|nr:hypothetical protein [Sphingobacteriaceae bacterium]